MGVFHPNHTVANPAFLRDVLRGLAAPQKHLPPKWLYDARGSALFEEITQLAEYDLTRVETALMQRHADFLGGCVPHGGALIEFGSGASTKTRILLDAAPQLRTYVPIDISETMLHASADRLRALYPDLEVAPHARDFTLPTDQPPIKAPSVGFFPGSTIGNLEPDVAQAMLARVRRWGTVEHFIIGADMIKDTADLVAAYDDTRGITAQFISNILLRANAELGADFDVDAYTYNATWNKDLNRIDMWLVSTRAQHIRVGDTRFDFSSQEPIHISASRKYSEASLRQLAEDTGWRINKLLTDAQGRFTVAVFSPKERS